MVDRMPKGILCLGVILALALAPALTANRALAEDLPIVVGVSVPPQAYLVERIGGERVEVNVMVPPGASPATYEPSPQQTVAWAGRGSMSKWGTRIFSSSSATWRACCKANLGISIVDMAAGTEASCQARQVGQLGQDPHLWLSPRRMRSAASGIEAALVRLDPAGATEYRRNLDELLADIDRLDREIGELLAGLRGTAIHGLSSGLEPSRL